MIPVVLTLAATAFVLSLLLTWGARAFGRRLLLLDAPGAAGHAKALRRVPNVGGIAIVWPVVLPMLAGVGFAWLAPGGGDAPPAWARIPDALSRHLPGMRAQTPLALALAAALLALHAMGLADDRRPIGPRPKFGVMSAAAALVVIGFDVRLLTLLDAYPGGRVLSILLTILWLIGVTNAMNFMDNMDGLAAGVGAVAGSLFLAAALINGQWFVAMTLALLVGATLGFLVFNFPRSGGATIFMGDSGSLVLGFLLAFLTVRTTYLHPGEQNQGWYAVFMPLCVLAVPLYDLVTVTLLRFSQGRSPLVGDQQHFSHRLRRRGLSVRRTLAVICGCTAITGIGGILLTRVGGWQALLIGVQTLLVLGVLGIYEHAAERSRGPHAAGDDRPARRADPVELDAQP